MSEQDSFIAEVSDEVRKDRLFALIRRYGWIAVSLVVLIVGGAAFNEWRKAQARAEAEARGSAILAALEAGTAGERAEKLAAVAGEGDTAAMIDILRAAETAESDPTAALAILDRVAADQDVTQIYRDLATLKSTMLDGDTLSASDRLDRLVPISVPGRPFRLLALEQTALAFAETGDTEGALSVLNQIIADAEVTQGLRQRASQLIVALGGSLGTG